MIALQAPLINPAAEELKKHEPKRSFSNQRPTAGRGRGGRGTCFWSSVLN